MCGGQHCVSCEVAASKHSMPPAKHEGLVVVEVVVVVVGLLHLFGAISEQRK